MKSRFGELTEKTLRKSGWFPNRNVSEFVSGWKNQLQKTDNKKMPPEAEKILLEFGGLKINYNVTNNSRVYLKLDPSLVIYENDRFEEFERKHGINLFPLGEAESGYFFLAVSETGKIFEIMDFALFVANSFDEALENLITGVKPTFVD